MRIINVIMVFYMDIFLETALIQKKEKMGIGGNPERGKLTLAKIRSRHHNYVKKDNISKSGRVVLDTC